MMLMEVLYYLIWFRGILVCKIMDELYIFMTVDILRVCCVCIDTANSDVIGRYLLPCCWRFLVYDDI